MKDRRSVNEAEMWSLADRIVGQTGPRPVIWCSSSVSGAGMALALWTRRVWGGGRPSPPRVALSEEAWGGRTEVNDAETHASGVGCSTVARGRPRAATGAKGQLGGRPEDGGPGASRAAEPAR